MMPVLLLLAGLAADQAPAVIHQSTSGWCSPVIANVTGNVTVNCIGVDPRALSRLNTQLAKKNQQLNAKIAEANQWVDRYHELETQLKAAGSNSLLAKQAEDYVHQGDFEKAKDILNRLLKDDEKDQQRIAGDYYQRGLISELEFKPLEALPDFERAYHLDSDNLRYANKYSAALLNENNFAKAEPVLNAAIQRGRDDLSKNSAMNREALAMLLYNRAAMMRELNRFNDAESDFRESIALFREIAREKPEPFLRLVSAALGDLGGMYTTMKRPEAAESALKEALAIDRAVPGKDGSQVFIAITLGSLAKLYATTGRQDEALDSGQQAVAILRDLARNKPAQYEPDFGLALNNLAAYLEAAGRLPEGESVAQEASEIMTRLAAQNPAAYRPTQAFALTTLADIRRREHRNAEADLAFQKALVIDRDLARESPQANNGHLATLLFEMGLNYSDLGRRSDAVNALDESLSIRRSLAQENFDVYGEVQAQSAVQRAQLEQNDGAAEPFWREAVDSYRRLSAAHNGAFDAQIARDLQELSVLYFRQKDLVRARQSAEESLGIFAHLHQANAEFNHESMARCMLLYAGLTERENASRACAIVGEAAGLATDSNTQRGAQQAYAQCSRKPGFRRPK